MKTLLIGSVLAACMLVAVAQRRDPGPPRPGPRGPSLGDWARRFMRSSDSDSDSEEDPEGFRLRPRWFPGHRRPQRVSTIFFA